MKWTRNLLMTALVAGVMASSLPLYARESGAPDCPSPGKFSGASHRPHDASGHGGMQHMLKNLALSEAQRDQIFKIKHAAVPAMREQGKRLRETREQLRVLSFSDKYDAARVKALAGEQARAMAELTVLRSQTRHAIYAVLTPEQRSKLQARLDRKGERHNSPSPAQAS
jgi:Spy/CpxP family protein refolding chaperone